MPERVVGVVRIFEAELGLGMAGVWGSIPNIGIAAPSGLYLDRAGSAHRAYARLRALLGHGPGTKRALFRAASLRWAGAPTSWVGRIA